MVVADVVDYDYGQTQPILAGAVSGDQAQSTRPNTSAGRASAINARKAVPAKPAAPLPEAESRPKVSRRRLAIGIALLVLVLLAGLAIGRTIVRGYYYVADYQDTVTIMRGIRGSILGLTLQDPWLVGCFNGSSEPYGQAGKAAGCQPLKMTNLNQSSQELVKTGLPYADLDGAKKQLQGLVSTSRRRPPPARSSRRPPARRRRRRAQPRRRLLPNRRAPVNRPDRRPPHRRPPPPPPQ